MVEYASVRSSLYDIDSLVSQLNERSGDGWEVVQILPTGGDVTAVLRRSDEPVAEAGADDTAGVAGIVAVDEEAAAIDAGPVAEAAVIEEIEADPVTEEPVVEEPVIEEIVEEPVVEEPVGWAAAPVVADTEPEPVADEAPAAAASAADTSTYAPVAEEAPAPEPEPVAAAAAVAAEPAPAPAPPSPPPAPATPSIPAGWYPDPAGRFELRYWDGNAWSEHTARQGQMYTDPPVA